jgi:hypothetical protein
MMLLLKLTPNTAKKGYTRSIHIHCIRVVRSGHGTTFRSRRDDRTAHCRSFLGTLTTFLSLTLPQPIPGLDDGLPDAIFTFGNGQRLGIVVEHELHARKLSVVIGEDVRRYAVLAEVLINIGEEDELAIVAVVIAALGGELVVYVVDVYFVLGVVYLHGRIIGGGCCGCYGSPWY